MEQTEQKIIEQLEEKIDKPQRSIDKLNKIFFWTMAITVALIVLPLIGLIFVVPQFLSNYGSILQQ